MWMDKREMVVKEPHKSLSIYIDFPFIPYGYWNFDILKRYGVISEAWIIIDIQMRLTVFHSPVPGILDVYME
jgi:hypothetical protein